MTAVSIVGNANVLLPLTPILPLVIEVIYPEVKDALTPV